MNTYQVIIEEISKTKAKLFIERATNSSKFISQDITLELNNNTIK